MAIAVVLLLWTSPLWAQADSTGRPVVVRVACREGMELIPSFWKGVVWDGGKLPAGLELKAVHVGADLARAAWKGKLAGGEYAWGPMDAALDSLNRQRLEVVLPLPVPSDSTLADVWPTLVYDTVAHTSARVSYFEIQGGANPEGVGRYLTFFESAVWAAYRADSHARVGGPGVDWHVDGLAALVQRASLRSLPLRFVSWQVAASDPGDLARSVAKVQGLLGQYPLQEPPEMIVSRWRAAGDSGQVSAARTMAALLPTMNLDLKAVCLQTQPDGPGVAALRAFEDMGSVRLPMSVSAPRRGVEGLATLDGEDVVALFWQRGTEPVPVSVSFDGLGWGQRMRLLRTQYGGSGGKAVAVENRVVQVEDSLAVSFSMDPAVLMAVRLHAEQP